ncbi:MAG: SUMF1/EgtB/PvdO family nonheme iron enzyme, partial [Bdellovibrionales bacterium]|nr:SUMF1/EgtB/PvdO family nonheme iron enzyme [Bdellovibrionales bacterium]
MSWSPLKLAELLPLVAASLLWGLPTPGLVGQAGTARAETSQHQGLSCNQLHGGLGEGLKGLAQHCADVDNLLPDLTAGCAAIGSCGKTNNRNKFKPQPNDKTKFAQSGGCEQNLNCPEGTQLVCSKKYSTKVCMDIDLKKDAKGLPEGNFSYHKCQDYCRSRGMRLPTNNEWLLASAGTETNLCLYPDAVYPIKKGAPMNDLSVNQPLKAPRPGCVSI